LCPCVSSREMFDPFKRFVILSEGFRGFHREGRSRKTRGFAP
jgi:hypothetical protein